MSLVCSRRHCGTVLRVVTDGMGRVAFICDACARNNRGVCRDCPAAIASVFHMRCTACARRRLLERDRIRDHHRYASRKPKMMARKRAYYAIPEVRARVLAYRRAYRAAHPRDEGDRLYHREYMRRLRASGRPKKQRSA